MMEHIVARVVFSEASAICTGKERYYVASVIKNRVGHKGFGKLKTMEQVVLAPKQFSCVDDYVNQNWKISGAYASGGEIDKRDVEAWHQALLLEKGTFTASDGIVYYHDRSIKKPRSWDNRYWRAVSSFETEHFIFYKVIER